MPADRAPQELAEIDALIVQAKAELERIVRAAGPASDLANPAGLIGCLEIWMAALYATRESLPGSAKRATVMPGRSH